jgi:hypothetical protein
VDPLIERPTRTPSLNRFCSGDVLYSGSMPAAGPGANLLTDKEKV